MKNKILLYTVIISFFSLNCWTQKISVASNEKRTGESHTQLATITDKSPNTKKKIKYYHVEEVTPLRFGGHKSVYDVEDSKNIRTYDLGPNNKRTITPVFENEIQVEQEVPVKQEVQVIHEVPALKPDTLKKLENSKIAISEQPKRIDGYAYIDIVKTYERVSDKGYASIDMLKKVGNSLFFEDELEKAEKCYTKLFSLTTDLEPEYYYRYSISLKAVGKKELSEQFLKKFNEMSNNKASK